MRIKKYNNGMTAMTSLPWWLSWLSIRMKNRENVIVIIVIIIVHFSNSDNSSTMVIIPTISAAAAVVYWCLHTLFQLLPLQ